MVELNLNSIPVISELPKKYSIPLLIAVCSPILYIVSGELYQQLFSVIGIDIAIGLIGQAHTSLWAIAAVATAIVGSLSLGLVLSDQDLPDVSGYLMLGLAGFLVAELFEQAFSGNGLVMDVLDQIIPLMLIPVGYYYGYKYKVLNRI